MNRVHQAVLIGSTILASWLGMQSVHECGHVLGAILTGAEVKSCLEGSRFLLDYGSGIAKEYISDSAMPAGKLTGGLRWPR